MLLVSIPHVILLATEVKLFAYYKMCAMLQSLWVRKLTGKPAFLTIADRRIHHAAHFSAQASNALRIHSDLLSGAFSMAALIFRCSSGESLAWMRMPRSLDFGILGLPILDFIK